MWKLIISFFSHLIYNIFHEGLNIHCSTHLNSVLRNYVSNKLVNNCWQEPNNQPGGKKLVKVLTGKDIFRLLGLSDISFKTVMWSLIKPLKFVIFPLWKYKSIFLCNNFFQYMVLKFFTHSHHPVKLGCERRKSKRRRRKKEEKWAIHNFTEKVNFVISI